MYIRLQAKYKLCPIYSTCTVRVTNNSVHLLSPPFLVGCVQCTRAVQLLKDAGTGAEERDGVHQTEVCFYKTSATVTTRKYSTIKGSNVKHEGCTIKLKVGT